MQFLDLHLIFKLKYDFFFAKLEGGASASDWIQELSHYVVDHLIHNHCQTFT
jgi:hypothetical protein